MIEKLDENDWSVTSLGEKLNEVIDRYNNHLHEHGDSYGGSYQFKTGLPEDIGFRNEMSPKN